MSLNSIWPSTGVEDWPADSIITTLAGTDADRDTCARIRSAFDRAKMAMGTAAVPQILITIAARFARVSWKYSSLAYALILKDVGVLTQRST